VNPILKSFLVLFGILVGFGQSFAQDSDSTKLAIKPFELTDITAELENSNTLIINAEKYFNDRNDLDDVQSKFFLLDSVLQISLNRVDTTLLSFTESSGLIAALNGYLIDIEKFVNTLNKRTSDLSDYRKEIKDAIYVWEITKNFLSNDNSSSTVLSSIQDILRGLGDTDQLMVEQIDVIFKSQNGITDRRIEIEQSLELLKSVVSKTSQKIFNIDSSPIWLIHKDTVSFRNVINEVSKNGLSAYNNAKAYGEQNIELIIINIVTILLLMVLIIYLKAKQAKLVHYHDQRELWIMFNHPLGLAILLGLLVFAPPYEFFPKATGDILVLLVYLTVTFILFPVISKKAKVFLLTLAFFLTFNTTMHFVSHYQIVGRILLLLESLAGVYIVYLVLKPGFGSYDYFNLSIAKWMIYFLPFAFLTFGLSAITNLLGASLFSEYLLYSTTKSIAMGILIFAGVLVLNGMIVILLRSPRAKTVYFVKEHSEILENRTRQLLQIGMFAFFLIKIAEEFNVWIQINTWFNTLLDFDIAFGDREITFRGIFAFFITILVSWWIARLLRLILEKELFQRLNLPRGIPGAISTSIYYFIISLGFFLALTQSGIELSQISIIIGALGVGIGFGLQNIISNFISGIILAFERPIQEGDMIEVGTLLGTVKSIGIRASKVRTFDGSEVIVPNNNLISNEVINWTLSDTKRRNTIEIGVAYGNNPRVVSEILHDVAIKYPKTHKDPEPLVVFVGFGDSSLDFKLHFWTYFDEGYISKSEVSMNVYDALSKAGIEIPFPQRVVTMKDGDKTGSVEHIPQKVVKRKE